MDELLEECKKTYGEAEGLRIFSTIMPGILGDFTKMLRQAGIDTDINEEYKIDDGIHIVKLSGKRHSDGRMEMHAHLI